MPPGVAKAEGPVALSDYTGLPGWEGIPMYFVGYTANGNGNYAKFATAKRMAGTHAIFCTGIQVHKSLLAVEPVPGQVIFSTSIAWPTA